MLAIASLSIVVVLAATRRHRAGMHASCSHIAVGFDASNGLGIYGQVAGTRATRTTARTVIVMWRRSHGSIGAIRGGKRVPMRRFVGGRGAIPLLKTAVRQLILGTNSKSRRHQQSKKDMSFHTTLNFLITSPPNQLLPI